MSHLSKMIDQVRDGLKKLKKKMAYTKPLKFYRDRVFDELDSFFEGNIAKRLIYHC